MADESLNAFKNVQKEETKVDTNRKFRIAFI
jgi:hypothetical protein